MPTTMIRGVELDHERRGPGTGADGTAGGPTVIWGHGLTSSRADEAVAPILIDWERATERLDVVRYDARGHGSSGTTPEPGPYGWDQLALDQLALADHLGIDRYVAAGASMGAATALHAAVAAPERIEGLVLVIPPTAWESRAAQSGNYATMVEIFEARGVEPVIAASTLIAPPDPFVGQPDYKERSAARMRAADPARLATIFRGAATADFPPRQAVAAIAAPTLILAWTGDPGHPISTARALHDLLPDAQVHEASTLDDLGTWTARLADFVTGLGRRGRR